MTRGYDEFVAALFDALSPQFTLLLLLVITGLTAALWYFWPAWVPRRLPRLRLRLPRVRWPRLRWPRFRLLRGRKRVAGVRKRKKQEASHRAEPDTEPGVDVVASPQAGGSLADRLAAQGRFAEAIRERLRETVTDLTRAGVVTPQPGTTAAELATLAATRRPAVSAPLTGATALFSEVWYGQRPASSGHDDRMRTLTAEVRDALHAPAVHPPVEERP
ncbi:DUF4129 domain-containing protein [Actinoplanes sp. NPDC051851]|uniref:DUF4129 domain-containing protein n=1 Tax=Actinoplanes sp. NPDC051851 TaxID=3154753 RepID=UPI00341B3476